MLWEALALLLGVTIGVITGLIPGLHINLVSSFVTSTALMSLYPLAGAIFIVSLAITHTLIDFIPSVYLGAINEETFLTVMPGHALLKEGNGYEAVSIAMVGALVGTLIGGILALIIPSLFEVLEKSLIHYLGWILIFLSIYLILREKNPIKAVIVFALAGVLGFVTVNLPVKEPLLPLLSGLFGASTLIISIKDKVVMPKQKTKVPFTTVEKRGYLKTVLTISIIGPLFSFLPALGSGYGSFILSEITKQTKRGFLFVNGCMNALIMIMSFSIVSVIGKARTGAAAAILKMLGTTSLKANLGLLLLLTLVSGVLALAIGLVIAKKSIYLLEKVNYSFVSIGVIVLITTLIGFISGGTGLVIFITSTALGLIAINLKIKRTNLMAALIVPTILYYLL